MGWILLAVLITYLAAPLAAYALIAPAYSLQDDAPIRTLVIAMGFGPIGISLLLFFLFTIAPGQSDHFYVSVIVFSIFVALVWGRRSLKDLLRVRASRSNGVHVDRGRGEAGPITYLPTIIRAEVRILGTLLGLLLFAYFINGLRDTHIFYVAVIVAVGIVPMALPPLARDADEIARNLIALLRASFAALRDRAAFLSARSLDYYLVVAFALALTTIVLVMVVFAGLTLPLTENDPLEYAMVSRAIYQAKSLGLYPILSGLLPSGLYAASSHPPAFHMLQVWGYFFDGSEATRMLRLSPLFYLVNMVLLMWTVLSRRSWSAAALGGLFVLSVPFLPQLAAVSHIDPMRIYFFFSRAHTGGGHHHPPEPAAGRGLRRGGRFRSLRPLARKHIGADFRLRLSAAGQEPVEGPVGERRRNQRRGNRGRRVSVYQESVPVWGAAG